jgi:hypothetical protein
MIHLPISANRLLCRTGCGVSTFRAMEYERNGLLIPGWKCKYCGRVLQSDLAFTISCYGSSYGSYEEAATCLMREV